MTPEDMAEARSYADKGPSVSRATVGRLCDEVERLRSALRERVSEEEWMEVWS